MCAPCKTESVEQLTLTPYVSHFLSFICFVLKMDDVCRTKLTWEHWIMTNWVAPQGCICVRGRIAKGNTALPHLCHSQLFCLMPLFLPVSHLFSWRLIILFRLSSCLSLRICFPSTSCTSGSLYPPPGTQRHPPPYSFLLFSLPSPSPLFTVIGCLLLLSLLPSSLPCSLPCCCVCQCSSCSSRGRRRLSCKPKPTLAIITELASNLC